MLHNGDATLLTTEHDDLAEIIRELKRILEDARKALRGDKVE